MRTIDITTTTINPAQITCRRCSASREAKQGKGGPKLPRGWHRLPSDESSILCSECWRKEYRIYATTMAVCGPVDGTWEELRAALDKDRKVVLTVHFSLVAGDRGEFEDIHVCWDVNEALPKRTSKVYAMTPARDGSLVYNDLSPDDPRQLTIDETRPELLVFDGEKKEVARAR